MKTMNNNKEKNEGLHWIRGDEMEMVEDSKGNFNWQSKKRIF